MQRPGDQRRPTQAPQMPLISQPVLPAEIILLVVRFLTWNCKVPSTLEIPYIPAKAQLSLGFSLACKIFHEIYMSEWFYLFNVQSPEDWRLAQMKGITRHIRILTVQDGALINHVSTKLNFSLENIQIITLDCHNDVGCSSTNKGQWSYKKVMPRLPRCLKSLVVLNAHGPDLQVIQQAVDQCPGLEDLYLGRCTKFNRQGACDFWEKFPDDHDSYFSNKGIEGYAKALGTELTRLKGLKSIYVNVYLSDTKYLYAGAARGSSSPENTLTVPPNESQDIPRPNFDSDSAEASLPATPAQTPQTPETQPAASPEDDRKQTANAEISAAHVLFECHKELRRVAFVSYWTPGHLGWSSHSRDSCDRNCMASTKDLKLPPAALQDTGGGSAYPYDPLDVDIDRKT